MSGGEERDVREGWSNKIEIENEIDETGGGGRKRGGKRRTVTTTK